MYIAITNPASILSPCTYPEAGCKDSKGLQIKLAATFQSGVFSRPQIDLSAGTIADYDD